MKRTIALLTLTVIFWPGTSFALEPAGATRDSSLAPAGKRTPGNLAFFKARRARRWAHVPRQVLAFYYTWYGRPERHGSWIHWQDVRPDAHEIATSTHYPALGAYDSHDPAVIDAHIDAARRHGIDGFICTWWGPGGFDDRAFVKVLDRAGKKDFQATVYWETAPGQGEEKIQRAVHDLLYVLDRYGSHPAFLKVDGKPVVFVYGRVMGQVSTGEWREIITRAERRYPRGFLLIADGYSEGNARIFDGIHTYNICGWVRGKSLEALRAASRASFRGAVRMAKSNARVSCITVIPGYDDTKIRTPGINAKRQGGGVYRVLWEEAIAADPDWIVITSWNEWHEGSEIEPSHEYGDLYLELTGKYAARFHSSRYSAVKVPDRLSAVSPERARVLRGLFRGTRIGLLPGYSGGAAFWLADTGIELEELGWKDLLDAKRFNAGRLPVVVYAGLETYTQTVKEAGDIDRALVRYLQEGGLLAALTAAPFPFFYNESHDAVVSARRFGFPITGGWESPPEAVRLTFEFNTEALPGLPPRAPFPASGDLRWRPLDRGLLAGGDVYLPLATLRDDKGGSHGDGIAYIEHRASAPKGGKNIYAWMRMADVADRDALFDAILRLAARKMTRAR